MTTVTPQLVVRIALVGVLTVIIEVEVVDLCGQVRAARQGFRTVATLRDPQGAVVPIAVGAAATAVSTIGFSLMQFLLGVDAPVSVLLVRQILLTIIVNAIIAGPVYALVRRVLTPALPDDPRRRRRRAYTTGGLSPLSRA